MKDRRRPRVEGPDAGRPDGVHLDQDEYRDPHAELDALGVTLDTL